MNFLIYTLGRTGSTLLMDLISHLPGTKCEGEILSSKPVNPYGIIADRTEECEGFNYGFKVKTAHLHNPRNFLKMLQEHNWKLIYLDRTNLVDICVSYLYARESGSFFYYKTKFPGLRGRRPRVELNIGEIIDMLDKNSALIEYDLNLLSDFSYLKINYELDLQCSTSHRNTLNKITEYFGLTYFKNQIKVPTTKSIPSHSKIISNWSNIYGELAKSSYATYL